MCHKCQRGLCQAQLPGRCPQEDKHDPALGGKGSCMNTYLLRTFIRRVLIVRLGIASTAIAIVVGLFTYGILQSQIKREVVDLGRRGVLTLLEKAMFVAIFHSGWQCRSTDC